MPALLETTTHERLGRGPKASRAIALSFHDHQKGGAGSASRRLSRARGHGVVRMDHVGKTVPGSSRSVELYLPVNWRRFCRRPFPIHVSARGFLLPRLSRKRVCSIPLGHTRAYSATVSGSTPSVRNRLPHQRLVNRTADRLHHFSRLSSVARLVGIDPNENGLTHAQASFAPGAKAND